MATAMDSVDVDRLIAEAATSYGYANLNEEQKKVLKFVQGKDVFVSLQTGYGKSLCIYFQR